MRERTRAWLSRQAGTHGDGSILVYAVRAPATAMPMGGSALQVPLQAERPAEPRNLAETQGVMPLCSRGGFESYCTFKACLTEGFYKGGNSFSFSLFKCSAVTMVALKAFEICLHDAIGEMTRHKN